MTNGLVSYFYWDVLRVHQFDANRLRRRHVHGSGLPGEGPSLARQRQAIDRRRDPVHSRRVVCSPVAPSAPMVPSRSSPSIAAMVPRPARTRYASSRVWK